ncbi:hypothetical protein AGMMS50239_27040 [Bacteroidia bacterium]|nr:hypothetical protein AGMMS50239_27040 [Bacteroidia bacterium]
MRCNNCGWENPIEKTKCEKCNTPLDATSVQESPVAQTVGTPGFNKTVREEVAHVNPLKKTVRETGRSDVSNAGGTVYPWSAATQKEKRPVEGVCSLGILPHENETLPEIRPVSYSGNQIILNRENTERENHTITSKEQAALTYENGKWYIEDKSIMKTTFIYVSKKQEIQSGDIIVLGNRKFIFKDENNEEQ